MKISIQHKFLFGFSIILLVALIVQIYFINNVVQKNNEDTISKELLIEKRNTDIYFRQFVLLNNLDQMDISNQADNAQLVSAISSSTGNRILLYSMKGDFIYDSNQAADVILGSNDDLKLAKEGKASYTINFVNKKVLVNFSYPVSIGNSSFGIFRYTRDYTVLYDSNGHLINLIIIFDVIIFIAIFILLYVLSRRITVPLIQLSKMSNEIAKGSFDTKISIKSNDEIGELADNFSIMTQKVQSQIETIKKDRDNLRELEQHRKLFFDNVTHELKTPLTTILGYAQIIEENGFNDEVFFKKGIGHIRSESSRLNRMVLDLLELSRMGSKNIICEFSKVDIAHLVEATCEEMSIKASRYALKIERKFDSDLYVLGNADMLKQAIINVIDNSIKYGNVGTVINASGVEKNGMVEIMVKDHGAGIPKEKLDKIFEPFYRVDKKKVREMGSNGLGLSIVKSIIDAHKGTIDIESEEGVGTKVTIKMPPYVYNLDTTQC